MTIGVLLMAYGTPERREDIEAYYTDIRRGRPPSAEQLADLVRRYDAIGGISPLAARTRAQRDGLQAALGDGYAVELGLKHADPTIEAGAGALRQRNVESVVGVVLAPHYSALSIGQYHERAEAALAEVPYQPVMSWHDEPALIELLADRWSEAFGRIEPARRDAVETVVTAHSLPERVRTMGDPYERQLEETARLIAERLDLGDRWRVAWQSAGRTPEPWLGPDLLAVIPEVAAAGRRAVVVCPAGFTSDHLEVLYDVDIEARAVAEQHDVQLVRTESLNADPRFSDLLARIVKRAA